jgi:hypothetical protein
MLTAQGRFQEVAISGWALSRKVPSLFSLGGCPKGKIKRY